MPTDRSSQTGESPPSEATPQPVTVDADRPLEESDDASEITPPLEAPIEAPIDDVVEQRRTVTLDEPDEH